MGEPGYRRRNGADGKRVHAARRYTRADSNSLEALHALFVSVMGMSDSSVQSDVIRLRNVVEFRFNV